MVNRMVIGPEAKRKGGDRGCPLGSGGTRSNVEGSKAGRRGGKSEFGLVAAMERSDTVAALPRRLLRASVCYLLASPKSRRRRVT